MVILHQEAGSRYVQLYATFKNSVLYSYSTKVSSLMNNSDEADQKIVRHALNCRDTSCENIVVYSIDYDVLILLISYVAQRAQVFDFASKVYFKLIHSNSTWYNISSLVEYFGKDVCKALPFFFAFTGCDTVSSFHGKGKCTRFDLEMKMLEKDKLTANLHQTRNAPRFCFECGH